MDDLISRQDAIDEAEEWIETYSSGRGGQRERDAIKHVIDGIKKLPVVQPGPKWIPCSERLLENEESVLATTAWGDVTIASRVYPPINDTCWFIHDGSTNASIDDVVAWMPLPEAYREEGDS